MKGSEIGVNYIENESRTYKRRSSPIVVEDGRLVDKASQKSL